MMLRYIDTSSPGIFQLSQQQLHFAQLIGQIRWRHGKTSPDVLLVPRKNLPHRPIITYYQQRDPTLNSNKVIRDWAKR